MKISKKTNLWQPFFKPLEYLTWGAVVIVLLLVWFLPTDGLYPLTMIGKLWMTALIVGMCIFVVVFYHWVVPRFGINRWVNWTWLVLNLLIVSLAHYLLYPFDVDILFAVVVAATGIVGGWPLALLAALGAIGADLLVTFLRVGTLTQLGLNEVFLFLFFLGVAYLTSAMANVIRRQAVEVAQRNQETAVLHQTARRQAERMVVINEITRAISSTIEMDKLLELIYQQISHVIPSDTYYVDLYNPEEDVLEGRILIDDGQRFPAYIFPLGEGFASWVIRERKPLLVRHLSKEMDSLPVKPVIVGQDRLSESWAGVPIILQDQVKGLLALASYQSYAFDEDDLALLTNVAGQAAIALDNASHHAQVEEQARRDSLTQVYNHGYFLNRLGEAVACARAEGNPVSLIMMDIDYFKQYNDTYGHVVGDQVLCLTVQAIQRHVKKTDIVGRWGGEEFGIVLSGATPESALKVAERIRQTLASLTLTSGRSMLQHAASSGSNGEAIHTPTVSQGIATFPDHVSDADQLVVVADRALYHAKSFGRDQIQVTNSPKV